MNAPLNNEAALRGEDHANKRTLRPDRIFKTLQLANGAERVEQYDYLGRLQQVDEPDGTFLRYGYDARGELDRVQHSSGEQVSYHRDGSELRAMTSGCETRVTFDANGFPATLTYRIDGQYWSIEYRRNAQGAVTAMRYPNSTEWLYPGNTLRCGSQCYATFAAPDIRFANGASTRETWNAETPANADNAAAAATLRKLDRIEHSDATAVVRVDQPYTYDEAGRVQRAGAQTFAYDAANRLVACGTASGLQPSLPGTTRDPLHDSLRYGFDADGRLISAGNRVFEYDAAPCVARVGDTVFAYDALGRRSARHCGDETQHYQYNLFGQLAAVTLDDGSCIRYRYDGFGRLIGREAADGVVYYIVDFEGHRLADCDASGAVLRSYLWFGASCIGAIDGVCGAPLAQSFHRVHGGTLAAIGDAEGNLQLVDHCDPYGSDSPLSNRVPGYACLFGDPVTGLLHASTRWLDPAIGQFICADSWFGTHALDRLPRGARPVLDALPGGTGRMLNPQAAYDWCARDPVNHCDPNGHNFMGLIWSTISAFLWSMQVTSIAFQMELISLVIFILSTFPGFMWAWNTEGWKRIAPWNGLPPLLGSSRLMVPFAFPLNSIWNAGGQVFTMGNVIWVNGDQMSTLEDTSQRDLIECSNAVSYRAATDEVAADMYRVRSANAIATATANASGSDLDTVAIVAPSPAPAAVSDVFSRGDWLSIRLSGATDPGELRAIVLISGTTITLDSALPAAFLSQAVDVVRLDPAAVHLQKDDINAARTLTFIRGNSLHIAEQLNVAVPSAGLTVTEYMPAGVRSASSASSTRAAELVRLADKSDQALYAAGDFLRVRAGADFSARRITRLRGARDLILDTALPADPSGIKYQQIEVAKMAADGVVIANQSDNGDRISVGNVADLRRGDGLAIDNTGGTPLTTERRIVRQVFLSCPVAALPASLQNVAVAVDLMIADTSRQAKGKNSSATDIDTAKDEAGRFSAEQPVRVRKDPNVDFFTTIASVDAANNKLTLTDALPAADFANGTDVTVHLLTQTKRLTAEPSASATEITLVVDRPDSPLQNDVIRVRDAAAVQGGVLRQINAAPNVIAQIDSALPATHVANLSVQRFTAVANTLKGNASAPLVQLRFTISGGANPFVLNDELFFSAGEEGYGKVIAAPVGQDIEIEHPIEFALTTPGIAVQRIAPTGAGTADAKLAESLILIPSDPDEDPITRRRAVESHEMRHVWQYSVLGPFFFSFPLPWLINLGFSAFGSEATGNSANKVMRHIGLGGLDSLFSLIAWGVGSVAGATSPAADTDGEIVDTELKVIQFPADADNKKIGTFTEGSPCEASKGGYATFNVIETLDLAQKKITLRFALESDKFAANDKVNISVSPFEKIRATVNKWFSLNLEQLWSQHIPVSWGRVLSKFLNRDSWFPLLGLYPIGFAMAGGNQQRMHFEQDASYHSGDLYNNFATGTPAEIYVGQFSRVMAFLMGRGAGDTATGLSDINALEYLTVETPTIAGVQAETMVFGGLRSASRAGRVRFRENYYMHLNDKIENAVGAFFAASQPGTYILHVPSELPAGTMVNTIGFDADFQKLRTITVKALAVAPVGSATDPLFETETLKFTISGDAKAKYELQYNGAVPPLALIFDAADSQRVTVPVGAIGTHTLDIKATYQRTNEIFKGGGQIDDVALTDAQLSNICQALPVTVQALTAPVIAAVQAGTNTTFQTPIAPASITVTSPLPAGATINASVINGSGRPATLTFVAPDAVTAAGDVIFDLVFGSGANTKTIPVTVRITPAP
jgi:YD repeat-containing protein